MTKMTCKIEFQEEGLYIVYFKTEHHKLCTVVDYKLDFYSFNYLAI